MDLKEFSKYGLFIFAYLLTVTSTAQVSHEVPCRKGSFEVNNGGMAHFMPVVNCPEFDFKFKDISETEIPLKVRENDQRYILSRMGDEFFENDLIQTKSILIYKDSVDEVRENVGGTHCESPAAFAFKYEFVMMGEVVFQFYTVYDSLGNRLSNNQIPNIVTDASVFNFLPICDIIEIAEKDKKNSGKDISDMRPQYIQEYNSYVWAVRKPILSEEIEFDAFKVLYIDAVTGEILRRREKKYFNPARMPN